MGHHPRKKRSRIDQDGLSQGERYSDMGVNGNHAGEGAAEALGAFSRLVGPPEELDSIDWLERHRRLSPEASAEPGPFRFDRIPYAIEPQRSILDPSVPEVCLCWAAQCAKTEVATLNPLLYWSCVAPGPALVVCPDIKMWRSLSRDRLSPMLRDSRVPGVTLEDDQAGGPGSDHTMDRMKIGNGMVVSLVHSLTATALSQRPIRYLIFEEASKLPREARGRAVEGDVIGLAKVRTSTFGKDAKVIYSSSPVEEELCRISALYRSSTQGKYYSKCPRGHLQVLMLSEMEFKTATCKCLKCGKGYPQEAWQEKPGRWIAEDPRARRHGYLLGVWPSPFVEWPTVFEEWREAIALKKLGDWSSYRYVCGNRLAETVKGVNEQANLAAGNADKLMQRREIYPPKIPDAIKVIVAGVDTQDQWLEYVVLGFGARRECWALETGQIFGRLDLAHPELGAELFGRVVSRTWEREDGRHMRIARMVQDCGGHLSLFVCQLLRPHWPRLMPSRGSALMRGELWRKSEEKSTIRAQIMLVNSSLIKDTVAGMLAIGEPGPGYVHFPRNDDDTISNGFNQEYFEQLAESEIKVPIVERGLRHFRWKQIRDRNEALDTFVLGLVALDTLMLDLDKIQPIEIVRSPSGATVAAAERQPDSDLTAEERAAAKAAAPPWNRRQRPRRHNWGQSASVHPSGPYSL